MSDSQLLAATTVLWKVKNPDSEFTFKNNRREMLSGRSRSLLVMLDSCRLF